MEYPPLRHLNLTCGPLAYCQSGRGDPLILIHGWRGSSSHWQETMAALADIRSVHAFDLPGHGGTPPRQRPLTTEGLASLAIDFADKAGLDRFDLVGHSFGSAVAVAIAAHWPDRVRRLVLTSLGTPRTDLERQVLNQAYAWMNLGLFWWRPWLDWSRPWAGLQQPWLDWLGGQPAVSRSIAAPFVQQWPTDDDLVSEGVREFLNTDPLSALEVAISAGSPGFHSAIKKVTAPVLLLSGDRDLLTPHSAVAALAEHLADCRLVMLENCGHMPMIEWPRPFLGKLREFLVTGEVAG